MSLRFHNHSIEFEPVDDTRPIDILAANRDITSFHLNIGLRLQGGGDPIAFINPCPGHIQSLLVQDYKGQTPWKKTFIAAEVQHEGSNLLDFAQNDLQYFQQFHG